MMLTKTRLCHKTLFLFLILIFFFGGLLTGLSIFFLDRTPMLTHNVVKHRVREQFSVPVHPVSIYKRKEVNSTSPVHSSPTTIVEEIEVSLNNLKTFNFEEDTENSVTDDSLALLERVEEGFLATVPSVSVPSVYYFLPHLLDSPWSLIPKYCVSQGRSGVSIVLGISIDKEEVKKLIKTLKGFMENMTPEEEKDTVIVVFLSETVHRHVMQVTKEIVTVFPKQVNTGLLEVVTPPATYYPKMNDSRPRPSLRYKDDQEQNIVKTNLDICFLMMYAQPKGKFFVQLQSGIVTSKNFISTMKNVTLEKSSENPFWLVLKFARSSIFGSMFKCVDLPKFLQFFFMFYSDQPLERLIRYFIYTKACLSYTNGNCEEAKVQLCLQYSPDLFHDDK